jgi:AcrR family transcriptional regulator
VRIARADGFPAVSMSRVAAELATKPMSLYRYVANKDELTILMMEAASGDPPAPRAEGESWRAALERWAYALMAMFREQRWFLQVPVAGPPATPRQLAWMEAGLAALDGTPIGEARKLSVMLLLTGFVRNEATLRGQMADAAGRDGRTVEATMAEVGQLMRQLVRPEQFPMLRRVIDAGAMDRADDPGDDFAFGLARILDGIEAYVS